MCQENYNTKKVKNKALQEFEHGILQNCLDNNMKTGKIAKELNRESSTIKKIITRYSIKICTSPKCIHCLNYSKCKKQKSCKTGVELDCGYCKECNIAEEKCTEYDPKIECKYLKGHKKVCNGCVNYKKCRKPKIVYKAEAAIKKQRTSKDNSKKKLKIEKITDEKVKIYNEYISPMIKRNISVAVILATMPENIKNILNISIPTLYKYIDDSIFDCRNIDLLNKVKRKENKKIEKEQKRDSHRGNGRSIQDMTEEQLKGDNVFEMDTVEGTKGSDLLLTIITMKQHFMFGLPMKSKTQMEVINELNKLEKIMGTENFSRILNIGRTDNGVEFLNYNGLEQSIEENKKRLSIFYADAYASYQKALVENNHRIIRYIIEKGYDMAKLSRDELLDVMNRVNNYPRKCLNYSTPYLEMIKVLDEKILKELGFYYIPITDLDMKTKKIV